MTLADKYARLEDQFRGGNLAQTFAAALVSLLAE